MTVFVSCIPVLELACIFPEGLFALLTHKNHFEALQQRVVSRLLVTLCTVEPLLATWRADGDLGIEDVFAAIASAALLENCGDRRGRLRELTTWLQRWTCSLAEVKMLLLQKVYGSSVGRVAYFGRCLCLNRSLDGGCKGPTKSRRGRSGMCMRPRG